MKITPALLALSLTTSFSLRADDEKKPAATDKPADTAAEKEKEASPADKSWAEIEVLLKGPSERPKSREEAAPIYKKYLAEMDEKGAAFTKAYPEDARRWKLQMHKLMFNNARQALSLDPLSEGDVKKILGEILDAKDAGEDVRSQASFMRVMNAEENAEEFQKLAETHKKEFPKFRGNSQIDGQLAKIAARKALKEKPLELAFTAVDGTEVDVAKMRGKVILIDFWATWCGPCVGEIPNVVASYKKLHESGFEILGISFDQDKDKLEKMTKEKAMPWMQFFDGQGWQNKFGQQFGINSIPEMWLVDKKGMVVDFNGREDLEKKVAKLLAE